MRFPKFGARILAGAQSRVKAKQADFQWRLAGGRLRLGRCTLSTNRVPKRTNAMASAADRHLHQAIGPVRGGTNRGW